jgi:chorismate mutase
MLSSNAQDALDGEAELASMESVLKRMRGHLESERRRVNEDIRKYPTPIPACDAQFNYLLEERAKIAEELDRLKALAEEVLTRRARFEGIGEFITSSNYINGEAEQKIRSSMLSVLDDSTAETNP